MRPLLHRLQGAALRALLALVSLLPMAGRRRVLGAVTEWAVRFTPLRHRALDNIELIWPGMPARERHELMRASARNVGRTLAGVFSARDFAAEIATLRPRGPGLDALRAAKAEGRGAVIVSGHFGQWDAIRHVLRREGMETGAIYRPNNNPSYEPLFRAGIEAAGTPIIARGTDGYRVLIRHLRAGGFVALLPDQHVKDGTRIPFLGQPALTALSAAELALRHGVPLVPAFAPEIDGRPRVTFEAPIPHSDPVTMMRAFNDRLSSWVERHPSQWHWLHRRWKDRAARRQRARAAAGRT